MKTAQLTICLILASSLLVIFPLTSGSLMARSPLAEQLSIRDIYGVTIQGERAYLAGLTGLAIVDLTDETQPRVVREFPRPVENLWVEVEGGLLYVGARDGLHIFHLRGEDDLKEMSRLAIERVRAFAQVGPWVYVLGRLPGSRVDQLLAVDLSSSTTPQVRGSHPIRSIVPDGFGISDDLAVVFSRSSDGVELVEIRSGYQFVNISRKRLPGSPSIGAIALDQRRLYVAANRSVRMFDVTNGSLREAGDCLECYQGTVTYLEVAENLLLVSGVGLRVRDMGELLIYDLTNLRQPIGSHTLNHPANANYPVEVEVVGSRVYLGEGWPLWWAAYSWFNQPVVNAGFRIIDITDPSAPHVVSYLPAGRSCASDVCRRQ
jgi:hypothetical protein